MTSESTAIGSDAWLGAAEYEAGAPLHRRATSFLSHVNWDKLTSIASSHRNGMPCKVSEKYSFGHFNLVRRITFQDGVNWLARLRFPRSPDLYQDEALDDAKAMAIEISSMKFLKAKTSIPVPEVYASDTTVSNGVGAFYILMEYIHGSPAYELRQLKNSEPYMYGTVEQDRKFREQMAHIQATISSFRFSQIGGLFYDEKKDNFYIGPELQTGKGPWTSSEGYFNDLAHHLMATVSQKELRQHKSFTVPEMLSSLLRMHGEEKNGPFRLTNRDFGPHNVLVNDNFDIVGMIDFDGVMAAPIEAVAQFPNLFGLEVEPPGIVRTQPAVVERLKRIRPQVEKYKELLTKCEIQQGREDGVSFASRVGSATASMYQGMVAYRMHQDFVNERWMKSCQFMLQWEAERKNTD